MSAACSASATSPRKRRSTPAFAKARAAHGQERILVNCAGTGNAIKTAGRDKQTGETKHFPLDAFNFIIQINLVGTFRCIAKSAKGMLDLEPIDGERGAIVNTASVAAEDGQMGQAAYSASKGGVVGMTLPIARDLAGDGIRVNTILPGIFDTPLMAGAPPQVKDALAASVPFPKRLGKRRGVRPAGADHDHQRLLQRRRRPPRRRHPHGAAVGGTTHRHGLPGALRASGGSVVLNRGPSANGSVRQLPCRWTASACSPLRACGAWRVGCRALRPPRTPRISSRPTWLPMVRSMDLAKASPMPWRFEGRRGRGAAGLGAGAAGVGVRGARPRRSAAARAQHLVGATRGPAPRRRGRAPGSGPSPPARSAGVIGPEPRGRRADQRLLHHRGRALLVQHRDQRLADAQALDRLGGVEGRVGPEAVGRRRAGPAARPGV